MTGQGSPSAGRMERKKERTRQRIVDTAMALFDAQGYDETTMEQIAEKADIAKGTLYNYFPVKEAIINKFMQNAFSSKHEDRIARLRVLPDTHSRMTAAFSELIRGIASQKTIFEKYLVYRTRSIVSLIPDADEESGLSLLSEEIIRLGQASGEIRTDLPPVILGDLFEFAIIEVIKQFYQQPDMPHVDTVIEQCVDFFLNGAGRAVEKNE